MRRAWGLMVLAFVVVGSAVVLVGSGGATQRLATAKWEVFPGPAKVTYDELIAYRATFDTESTSTLNKVKAKQTVPTANGVPATIDSHTCPSTPQIVVIADGPDEWVCDFGTVASGAQQLVLTTIWKVPTLAQETICTDCLKSTGWWTVKEGTNDTSDVNDKFGLTELAATLLPKGAIPEVGGETLLAGGYETAAASCAGTTSAGNLKTHGAIGLLNPIVTKVCHPAVGFGPLFIPPGSPDSGYATTLTETLGNARHTVVCIAALGTNCGGTNPVDQNFFPAGVVTVVINVVDAAIQTPAPGRETIETVSHNGTPMDGPGGATCVTSGDCLLSIDLDNKTKVWTILLTSGSNGFYDW